MAVAFEDGHMISTPQYNGTYYNSYTIKQDDYAQIHYVPNHINKRYLYKQAKSFFVGPEKSYNVYEAKKMGEQSLAFL